MKQNIKLNNTAAQIAFKAVQRILKDDFEIASSGMLEYGFFIEFKTSQSISSKDFSKIEKEMKKVISSGEKIEEIKSLNSINKYQKVFKEENKESTFIKIGKDFENVSAFEIEDNVNKVKIFKLTNIGGSYWQNNASLDQLTRISGVAFTTKEELEEWDKYMEEIKSRDHRKIGQDMEIFDFSNDIGQGLPIWLPNGEIIKKEIKKFLWSIFSKEKFLFIDTPILGSKELYIKSGHWEHYKENNFPPMEVDNETFMLRPMTCPHHLTYFNLKPHSYKELPYAICEDSKLHRYESSGGLIGLERVRTMELFDCHIITKPDQIEDVIRQLNNILKIVHKRMNIKIDRVDLSLRDPKDKVKYHDDDKMWKSSEKQLRDILKKLNYKAMEIEGEAAFYGPKIDFQVKTNLGKIITISTIQLDFLLPERFDVEYIDENNTKKRPVLIHFGVIGTYERFIATLLSQTKGLLPFWLAPVQISIIPVNNNIHLDYCKKIASELEENNIRVKLDDSNERLAKKIREAQISKIPFQLVIGDNEIKNNEITYRKYSEENSTTLKFNEFIDFIKKLKKE
ncbi:threonine--tRNA ligase [Malacoplasma penetrans]|uniref:Threonine--tRNA ligase n=1 Tax=Malacoplasma penetrans (strain HF-2) TaxID=272633 RepID=Q8EWD0_MALP2|nr:threonine--tRNA ligase [Malacoplasma penetrans]RXY96759.1 threonine--tRNA ligase [Malacoplasma penetrans]BAC44066.1 threonyl-tRNA synthetase [Malacoplasma penetrans HF-2]